MPSTPFQTSLDQDLVDRARAKAQAVGKSLEQILSDLINDWVGNWQPATPPSAPPQPQPPSTNPITPPAPPPFSTPPLSPPATPPEPAAGPQPTVPAPPVVSPTVAPQPPAPMPPAAPPKPPAGSAPPPAPSPAPAHVDKPEPRTHLVRTNDTLWDLAVYYYGDGTKYMLIARENDIHDGRRLQPGMRIVIPTDPASLGLGIIPAANIAPRPGYPIVPDGLAKVREVFGSFRFSEIRSKPVGRVQIETKWLAKNIVRAQVPTLGTIQCHKLLAPVFVEVFRELEKAKLTVGLKYYGCFLSRHKMWQPGRDLSVHSWGIAIDLNADTNAVGTAGTMDVRVIEIFAKHGFYWGGNFGDPMHFQYCLNY